MVAVAVAVAAAAVVVAVARAQVSNSNPSTVETWAITNTQLDLKNNAGDGFWPL